MVELKKTAAEFLHEHEDELDPALESIATVINGANVSVGTTLVLSAACADLTFRAFVLGVKYATEEIREGLREDSENEN